MSRTYVPAELRRRVAEQGRFRCGYCLTQQDIVGTPMDIEHIIPESVGGATEESNLWISCALCNSHKASRTKAIDPLSSQNVNLFNPRDDVWEEHFEWAERGALIVGLTAVGRATVGALMLNREPLVFSRRKWIVAG